jgi:hypothetical protein
VLAMGASMLLSLASCNIVAPVAMIIEGPPKDDAQFKLEKSRTTLILVDDTLNILPRPRFRQTMATTAQEVLLKKKVLTKVIDSGAAYALIARDREGQVTSVVDVAKAVDADIVVSVTIDSFGMTGAQNEMELACSFRVKVLDATKATEPRVWPPANVVEGASGIARYRLPTSSKIETSAEAYAAQNALAEQTGRAIAQFFYTHLKTESAAAGK